MTEKLFTGTLNHNQKKKKKKKPIIVWSDLDLFYGKVKFGNLGFSIGKSENSGFSETIVASDLKVSRIRHLIEYMKICDY